MKDRTGLRNEFDGIVAQKKADANFASRSNQLSEIQKDLVDGFNFLVKFLDGKTSKTEITNHLKQIGTPDVEKVVKAVEKLDKTTIDNRIDLKPVLVALKGLKDSIIAIPTPDKPKDFIKVTNLDEIKFDVSEVIKAIKALDLKVDVKAPVINIEKPNLKPLQDLMLDLLKAFNKFKVEPTKEVKINNLKDIPPADLSKVEKKLDESNKHLKVIAEKKSGGSGGGGGESTLQFPLYSPTTTTINTVGLITTIVKTNGIITKTTTVDKTSGTVVSVVWS